MKKKKPRRNDGEAQSYNLLNRSSKEQNDICKVRTCMKLGCRGCIYFEKCSKKGVLKS